MYSRMFWGLIFLLAIAAIIVAIVVWAVNTDDSDDSDNDNGGHNDIPICKDITNTWKGRELNRVRIHIRGHHDQVLSPSAVDGDGLCFLGNTSQPLSVVDCDQEPDPSWAFDKNGFLQYTCDDIFTSNDLPGIDNHYYLTLTKPKPGDEDNTIDAWYGIDNPKGTILPASMTIAPINTGKGCQPPLCIIRDEKTGHITTTIDGKIFYLTANKANNFVFWYESKSDCRFSDRQCWSVQMPHEGDEEPVSQLHSRSKYISKSKGSKKMSMRKSSKKLASKSSGKITRKASQIEPQKNIDVKGYLGN